MTRTFSVASDEAITALISTARHRLVVVAPALSRSVAAALARRLDDLGKLDVTVVLDSDPEVYRLGFGDREALDTIHEASNNSHFDLREQPGVRIGVIVSDDTTMVYAPISRNIEAGSTSDDKPNAIVLTGSATDRVASAAGAYTGEDGPPREVGSQALEPEKVAKMEADLIKDPPRPFDITRRLNVFSSRVQYVEIEAKNSDIARRQVPLPPELVGVADDGLRDRITARIRAPFDAVGKIEIKFQHKGQAHTEMVDGDWIKKERKRIEDRYTFQINNFGRVILYSDRDAFDDAVSRFETILEKYQSALRKSLEANRADFEDRIVAEFAPRWQQSPPSEIFKRWSIEPTPERIRSELKRLAQEVFASAVTFEAARVKVLYKNVAPENIRNSEFLDALKGNMERKRVPRDIIDSLFETGEAAPATGAFVRR